jgi:hypothetical protein
MHGARSNGQLGLMQGPAAKHRRRDRGSRACGRERILQILDRCHRSIAEPHENIADQQPRLVRGAVSGDARYQQAALSALSDALPRRQAYRMDADAQVRATDRSPRTRAVPRFAEPARSGFATGSPRSNAGASSL